MAFRKEKSIYEMSVKEVFRTMEALGVPDDGLESVTEMRSRLIHACNQAEKTRKWSPIEVRYFRTKEF